MPIDLVNHAIIGEELALAWGDGMESYLPMRLLREACPCAACQGEPDALGRVIKPRVELAARSVELQRWEEVGGYALRLFWADGHSTGLYSYQYLRSLGAQAAER